MARERIIEIGDCYRNMLSITRQNLEFEMDICGRCFAVADTLESIWTEGTDWEQFCFGKDLHRYKPFTGRISHCVCLCGSMSVQVHHHQYGRSRASPAECGIPPGQPNYLSMRGPCVSWEGFYPMLKFGLYCPKGKCSCALDSLFVVFF